MNTSEHITLLVLLIISESLPFIPVKYNGIVHSISTIIKNVYEKYNKIENNNKEENKPSNTNI